MNEKTIRDLFHAAETEILGSMPLSSSIRLNSVSFRRAEANRIYFRAGLVIGCVVDEYSQDDSLSPKY
jgi:hypothetical protein